MSAGAQRWPCAAFVALAATAYLIPIAAPADWGSLYIGLHLLLTLTMLMAWRAGQGARVDPGALLAAGVATRLLLIGAPPFTSNDVERYLWDGAVWLAGHDPYRLAPAAAELAGLRATWPTPLEHAAYATLYPPAALALFALAASTGAGSAVLVWKGAVALASVVTLLLAAPLLRARGAERHLALVALSPLLVLEGGVGGHLDVFSALAVVAALGAVQRGRAAAAGVALAAGMLLKLLPVVVALPLAAASRRRAPRLLAVAAATGVGGYGLAAAAGLHPLGSLLVFFDRWEFGSPVSAALRALVGAAPARAILVGLCLAGLALAIRIASRGHWVAGVQLALAAPLLTSPVVFPWYLLPLVPVAALAPSYALLGWLTVAPLTYEVLNMFAHNRVWQPAAWPLWCIALAWGVGGAADALRWRARRAWGASGAAVAGAAALCLLPALPAGAACRGDCGGDGQVTVNELVTAVGVALGARPFADCLSADGDGDGEIGIAELIAAVNSALAGCLAETTPTATDTALSTAEPTLVPTATAAPPATPSPTVPAPSATPLPTVPPATATPAAPQTTTATIVLLTPTPTAAPSTATTTSTAAPATPPSGDQDPPTRGGPLRDWLDEGNYLGWAAESAPHRSSGPHFGNVRVFVNDRLLDSLERGLAAHPSGAAAVKELYGSGSELMGWAVMVKVEDDSDGGQGWYWYERFNTSQFANGRGVGLCTGCHSAGLDYIRIPFPLL